MRAGPTPVNSTILSRAPWPETIVTASRGDAQCLRDESHDRVVRASVLGRRGDTYLPRIAVTTDDLGPAGAGLTRSRNRVVAAPMGEV